MEAMAIIDVQVYAYEPNHPVRPWTGHLRGPPSVTGAEMVAAMDAVGVDGALLVSPLSRYRYDASCALEVYAAHPGRFALIEPVDTTERVLSTRSPNGPPSVSATAIDPILFAWLNRDGVLATDELGVYQWFGSKMRRHVTVDHKRSELARWDRGIHAHTNICESLFGLFKWARVGVWHWISAKHLHRYGVEREVRWNTRKADGETRIACALIGQHGRLRLRALFA
jgi:hypothetical protein